MDHRISCLLDRVTESQPGPGCTARSQAEDSLTERTEGGQATAPGGLGPARRLAPPTKQRKPCLPLAPGSRL